MVLFSYIFEKIENFSLSNSIRKNKWATVSENFRYSGCY